MSMQKQTEQARLRARSSAVFALALLLATVLAYAAGMAWLAQWLGIACGVFVVLAVLERWNMGRLARGQAPDWEAIRRFNRFPAELIALLLLVLTCVLFALAAWLGL